ncbi:MAG: gamma-glutamyl-gamma-aminobutyrate hydrolase family protein [Oligosphaeraceae bacterium]|nr:gamma-glutamyl-gamma-aminobutyrate hydrolase family protein [Oligosphaeraceae bacterium]
MSRPIIAITAFCNPAPCSNLLLGSGSAYTDAVLGAGGYPVILAPAYDLSLLDDLRDRFAGVILTGGPDVPGHYYGQDNHPDMNTLHEQRARWDLALAAKLLQWPEMPVLGVCLGCQELNVAGGGTLHQHLPDAYPQGLKHSFAPGDAENFHRARIAEDSLLAELFAPGEQLINSSHHQAVKEIAPGFRAVAWSADGVVEAIEPLDLSSRKFCLGVQWHPERIQHLPLQRKILQRFIQSCR